MELERRTLLDYFKETVHRKAEGTAVVYGGRSFSWQQLDRCSDLLALRLSRSGLRKGEHIGIWSTNSYNWIIVFLAAVKLQCLPVAVNTAFKTAELKKITEYADLKAMFFSDGYKGQIYSHTIAELKELHPELLTWQVGDYDGDLTEEKFEGEEGELPVYDAEPDDVLAMLLTSGTTGDPKGVMLSHYNLTNTARNTIACMGWQEDDRMCITVPLFHCFGLTSSLISSLILGCTMCLVPSFRTTSTLDCISRQRCTILNGVPTMFLALTRNPRFSQYDISSLRCGIIAGSAIFPAEYLAVCQAFAPMKLVPSYGQTETSPAVSFSPLSDPDEKNATNAGVIIPHVEARVVSTADRHLLPAGESGELEVRGYNVMQGYYKMPEMTAYTINEDGWLKTGDLAYFDEEGYLYICGRCKDLIIRGGENISPQEIERVMLEKCDWLQDVCVVSVPAPVIQERIIACVIPKKGEELQANRIRQILKLELADYKVPDHVLCFERFPATTSGKVQRSELRKLAMEQLGQEEHDE